MFHDIEFYIARHRNRTHAFLDVFFCHLFVSLDSKHTLFRRQTLFFFGNDDKYCTSMKQLLQHGGFFSKIKKLRPNYGIKGGVNTLSNKKCLVGRTVMIQSALHSPDVGKCFTYSARLRTNHKKISTGF